jgi:hypothetical protein
VVQNAAATARLAGAFDVLIGPQVTRVVPNSIAVDVTTPVTIEGSGFQPGAAVRFETFGLPAVPAGGVSVAADGRSITATALLSRVGFWDAVVTNPDGNVGRLPQAIYADGPPIISRMAPDKAGERDSISATVNGSSFAQGSSVMLERLGEAIAGITPLVSLDGRNILTSFDLRHHTAGLWDVVVTGPTGLSARAVQAFELVSAPKLDSIAPHQATVDGINALIYGSNFQAPISANLVQGGHVIPGQRPVINPDGTVATFFGSDANGLPAPAGLYDVVVLNKGVAGDTLHNGFEFLPSPIIDHLVPAGAPDNAPVTILAVGARFAVGCTVLLRNNIDPDLPGVVTNVGGSGSQLETRFDLTGKRWGGYQFVVRNPDGLQTQHAFSVFYTPRLDSIAPNHAENTGPVDVTIYGKPFETPMLFQLIRPGINIPGTILSALGSSAIRVRFNLLSAPIGSWDLLGIATNFNTRDTLEAAFQIDPFPRLTSVYPASVSNSGPVTLFGQGNNFDPLGTTQLERAGVAATIPGTDLVVDTMRTSFSARYDVTDLPTGFWDVRFTDHEGRTTLLQNGLFVFVAAQIDSIVPARGPNSAIQPVVVYGKHFPPGVVLRLFHVFSFRDSILPVGTPVVSPDGLTISASMDLRGKGYGLWDVYVEGPGVQSARLQNAFEVVQDGPVPTLLARFDARRVGGAMEVRWQFTEPDFVRDAAAERSPSATGPWTALAGAQPDGAGGMVARDPDATSGAAFYRLVATTTNGEPLTFGPIEADGGTAGPGRSTLESIAPNPVRNTTRIRLALAREERVHVTVHDLLGREVARLVDGVAAAGALELTWDPCAGTSRLPGGLYFLRFEAGGVRQVRRVVLTP